MHCGRFLAALVLAAGSLTAAAAFAAAPPGAVPVRRPATAPRVPAAKPGAHPTPGAGVSFRAIGPAVSGGRVAAVAGSDRDPSLYYVGGAAGGVFKSTDAGTTFESAWDGPHFGAIGAIAVAPSDPRVVWVGTGEANPRNDVSYGDGVWLTRDGAKHWTHAGLDDSSLIAKILVDPVNPNHAIVAALGNPWKDSASRGVYVTGDGGKTWRKTLYAGPASGAADLAWNVHAPRTIFAAIWQFRRTPWSASSGGAQDGLYRSRDGGQTWAKIRAHGFPTDVLGRIGIAVAPSDPKRVYAVVQSRQGTVWRSDDAGDSWRKTSSDTTPRATAVLLQPSRSRSEERAPGRLGVDVLDRLEGRRRDVEAPHRRAAPRQPRTLVVVGRSTDHRRQRRRRRTQPQRRRNVGVPRPHPARADLSRRLRRREAVHDLRRTARQQRLVRADYHAQRHGYPRSRLVRDFRRRRAVRDPRSTRSQLDLGEHAERKRSESTTRRHGRASMSRRIHATRSPR